MTKLDYRRNICTEAWKQYLSRFIMICDHYDLTLWWRRRRGRGWVRVELEGCFEVGGGWSRGLLKRTYSLCPRWDCCYILLTCCIIPLLSFLPLLQLDRDPSQCQSAVRRRGSQDCRPPSRCRQRHLVPCRQPRGLRKYAQSCSDMLIVWVSKLCMKNIIPFIQIFTSILPAFHTRCVSITDLLSLQLTLKTSFFWDIFPIHPVSLPDIH